MSPEGSKRRRKTLTLASWNVNGLRAAAGKGFGEWLGKSRAQVVGIQEVRAREEQIPEPVRTPKGWHTSFVHAERKGYSGVGLYSRDRPDEVVNSLGLPEMDQEGRVQLARFGALRIANVYFPNGNGKDRDNSRVPFKLRFYRRLFDVLQDEFQAGAPLVVMGDFNTAPAEIDLARPKQNQKTSGFLPQERQELARWLQAGWIDSFRQLCPDPHHYTWWSQRIGVREKNIGWRLDLALVSPGALPHLRGARIYPKVMGSDHCPISLTFDGSILDR